MSERAPYSRVYWAVVDDPKFATIYGDDHHLATWLRLLMAADALWPASCHLPATVRKSSVKALADAGLIDISAFGFRIHGLDSERGRRREAASRPPTGRAPSGTQTGTEGSVHTGPTPSYTTPHHTEPSRAQSATNGAAPPRPSTVDRDPLYRAQREAIEARYGADDDSASMKLMTAAEQDREARRLEGEALHQRFLNGHITEAVYERLRQDIGKEPDDLTRFEASPA